MSSGQLPIVSYSAEESKSIRLCITAIYCSCWVTKIMLHVFLMPLTVYSQAAYFPQQNGMFLMHCFC